LNTDIQRLKLCGFWKGVKHAVLLLFYIREDRSVYKYIIDVEVIASKSRIEPAKNFNEINRCIRYD